MNLDILWDIVQYDLPPLIAGLQRLIEEEVGHCHSAKRHPAIRQLEERLVLLALVRTTASAIAATATCWPESEQTRFPLAAI